MPKYKICIIKAAKLMLGFFFIAYGINMMISSNAGLSPWGVFQQGLSFVTKLTYGQISQIVGFVIIVCTIPLKVYPGIGTVLNMYFCGFFVDFIKNHCYLFYADTLYMKYVIFFVGLVIFTYGIFLYISCNLGAGPRDGLMVGLIKLTKIKATYIKPAIELTVLTIGFFIGGTIGLGTLVSAFIGGRILDLFFNIHKYDPKTAQHVNIKQMFFNQHVNIRC